MFVYLAHLFNVLTYNNFAKIFFLLMCIITCQGELPNNAQHNKPLNLNCISINAENAFVLEKKLRKKGIKNELIKKILEKMKKTLGENWYDANAELVIKYSKYKNKIYLNNIMFNGAGVKIDLSTQKIISSAKHLVIQGVVNNCFEQMISKDAYMPYIVKKNILQFVKKSALTPQNSDKFFIIYDALTYKIYAMKFFNKNRTESGILFNNKFLNFDGKELKGNALQFQLPVKGRISSLFGWRTHPVFRIRKFHYGLDLAAPIGTPIRSAADGVVIWMGAKGGYGKCIEILHSKGPNGKVTTLYGHMNNYALNISVGSVVKKGQIIGAIGMTGWTSGPHCHYEIAVNGVKVDPLKFTAQVKIYKKLPKKDLLAFQIYKNSMLSLIGRF